MSPIGIKEGRRIYRNTAIKDFEPEKGVNRIMMNEKVKL
jgi:hypothetical protein